MWRLWQGPAGLGHLTNTRSPWVEGTVLLLLVPPRRQPVLYGQVLTWRRLELELVGWKLLLPLLLGHSGWRCHVRRWLIGAGITISARR